MIAKCERCGRERECAHWWAALLCRDCRDDATPGYGMNRDDMRRFVRKFCDPNRDGLVKRQREKKVGDGG